MRYTPDMDETNLTPLQLDQTSQTSLSMGLIGGAVISGFIALVVFVIGVRWMIRRMTRPEMTGMTREEVRRKFDEIRMMSQQGIMGAKLAVMEADTILDMALKSMMMPGETLGERLKVAGYKYPKLRNVWWAHKLRNSLAHDATFQISVREAKQALDAFENALEVLNIL